MINPTIFDGRAIADHLPGEPRRAPPATGRFLLRILVRLAGLGLLTTSTLALWPAYLLAARIWGRPPNVVRAWQARRYLRLIWTVRPPAPGLRTLTRVWLTLAVLRKAAWAPVVGLAWILDLLLYGARLRATAVVAPLFEISAARSGSTQLARYLEEDPRLAAPSVLEALFPYLWLWRLAPRTLGRLISAQEVRAKLEARFPPEFVERHEGDPFRTDTFEGAFYLAHLTHLAPFLGPEVFAEDFGLATLAGHNRALWERDFVEFLDGVARKTLVRAGLGPDGRPRRLFVKGHFLAVGDALERRYPDARFLTMIREPGPRLQSAINFLHVNPIDEVLGHIPWPWVAEALVTTEVDYCEREQAWFQRRDGAHRCVLRFADYVDDLEGAMTKVYRACLDSPSLPDQIPREHPPRERSRYTVNRSLAELGIDGAALDRRLQGYIAWCRGG